MKQLFFFFILNLLLTQGVSGQSDTDYNLKGDRAFDGNDLQGARSWYSEGLDSCDPYSIQKLTEIWNNYPEIQKSMRFTMKKCHNCLIKQAEQADRNSILQLINYYNNGIGTEKDSIKANYWLKRISPTMGIPNPEKNSTVQLPIDSVTKIIHPGSSPVEAISQPNKPKKTKYFAAYTFSPTMPLGITLGAMNQFGVYLSYKTNLNKPSYAFDCTNTEVINYQREFHYFFDETIKWKSSMLTAGILLPFLTKGLYLSVGSGYAKRDLYWHITEYDDLTNNKVGTAWCHNTQSSYKGIVAELGGLYRYKSFIFSGGINSTALRDLDCYIGFGMSF